MKTKLLALSALLLGCAFANAGTYTWTGAAGDGLYFTAGNWDYTDAGGATTSPAATSPGNSVADDIVISGENVVVEYVPGGDWNMRGMITISGGARLVQTTGGNYATISGTMILDGGAYDAGTCTGLTLNGRLKVYDGGELAANVALGRGSASVLELHGGVVPVYTGNYFLANYPNDIYDGGTFTLTGELQPPAGDRTWEGTQWICKMFSPRGAGVHTFRSGSLTTTTTSYSGYYQNNSCINIPSDSTASFTWNYKASEIYSKLWSGNSPRFRYAGSTLTQDEFETIFECIDNGGKAPCTFRLAAVSPYGITSPSATDVGETSATISAFVSNTEEEARVYALWGAAAAATDDLSAWDHAESVGAAVAETTFTKSLSGLTTDVPVYYAFAIVTNGAVAAATAVASFEPSAYTAKFLGTVSTAANVAANWRDNVVPTSSDTILIAADCDWGTMSGSANLSLQNWNVTVEGAALRLNGEVNRTGAATIRNGSLSASVFVGSGTPIEVRGSDMVSTTTRGDITRGFYSNGPFFNFHSGDACSYTYHYNGETAPAEADEFNALFAQGRILVDGAVLTDSSRVSISVDTENSTVTATLLESVVEASFESASTAAVNGLSATLSAVVEVGGGRPLYVLTGSDPANLTATLVAAEAADNTTYTYVATGAEGTAVYWQFRLGEAADGLLDTTVPQSFFAMESGNLWTGALSGLASVPGNWSKGHVPTAAEPVYVVAEFAHNDLEWDVANATVGSWKQLGDAVVYLNGATNNVLTIAGDAELSGGYWTHSGPADEPSTILNVAVGGDLTVAAGAAIQTGTGTPNDIAQRSRGYTRAHGPGYVREAGGSFAGEGGHVPAADFSGVSTYGSILDPLSYGSGGWGDNANYAGGGVIKLAVAGALTVNGTICSRGFGYPQANEKDIGGAGSGGSINIVAASLSGTGSIDANGGSNGLYGPGSGGRIKVALTGANASFADFDGIIEAVGGSLQNNTQATTYDITPAAAGTVCLSTAADTMPTVRVHNEWRYGGTEAEWRVATDPDALPSGTHLPAMQATDAPAALKTTRWELSGHGAIRLTADARVASLALSNTNGAQRVYTESHTLTVKEFVVGETRYPIGRYTAAELPAVVKGTGTVEVEGQGTVILFQ